MTSKVSVKFLSLGGCKGQIPEKIKTKDRNAVSTLHVITEKLQLKIEGGGGV